MVLVLFYCWCCFPYCFGCFCHCYYCICCCRLVVTMLLVLLVLSPATRRLLLLVLSSPPPVSCSCRGQGGSARESRGSGQRHLRAAVRHQALAGCRVGTITDGPRGWMLPCLALPACAAN
jgi:hypothetical protein